MSRGDADLPDAAGRPAIGVAGNERATGAGGGQLPGDEALLHDLEALAATALPGDGFAGDHAPFGHASFVRLGGNSLLAMAVAGTASERLGVRLDMRELLGDAPLRTVLAAALSTGRTGLARQSAGGVTERGHRAAGAAASAAQRGMWIREQTFGPLPYNLVCICFIDGPLDAGRLAAAVAGTARRHDGLRTVFVQSEGEIQRRVLPDAEPPLRRSSACEGAADFAGQARALAGEIGSAPFDLSAEPPLRFVLASRDAHRHALIMTAHHMLIDGWAIGIMLREIFARYEILAAGKAPDLGRAERFDDFLHRQERLRESGELDRQARFWQRELSGAPLVLDLPADRARPAFQAPEGARCPFRLDPQTSDALRRVADRLGITPAAFLLAAFALTLSRYTGATDLLVATPVAGRPTTALAELVAVTVNVVPVRVRVDDGATAAEYLSAVQRSLAGSLDNSDLAFDELVGMTGAGGSGDRHPLCQVAFGMHDGLIPSRLRAADLDIAVEEGHGGGAQFDIELFVRQGNPVFAGDLEYAVSVWQAEEAAGFCADLGAAVAALARQPAAPLEDIRGIAPARLALLSDLNRPSGRVYPPTSIDEAIREWARRSPDATAVRDGACELSYAELAQAAAAQARLLADAGVTPGSTVIVATGRSVAETVAVLGVLWSGAAYVAVESGAPASRVGQIMSVARPVAVLGEQRHLADAARRGNLRQVPTWPDLPGSGLPPLPPDPDRLANVTFTSGSTGIPKGVSLPHRGVLRLISGLGDYAPIGPGDRVLRYSPLAFDASTLEMWMALLTGASLEIHPPGVPTPADLGRFIRDAGVSVAFLTAGLFSLMCEFAIDDLGGLHHLLTGGDVVSADHVSRVLARHRGLVVINAYGPTENTVITTVHRIADVAEVEDPLPVGRPIAHTQVHILDQRGRLVPPGGIGELYAAGDGLATGYLGNPEQSARSFGYLSGDVRSRLYRTGDIVRLDGRGRLRFLGRRDDQVKLRGFRIELGEIRTALLASPQLSDAYVTVTGDGNAKQVIAACVPARDGVAVPDLAGFLAGRLPGYMIPALWAIVPELPLTPNGKVDRDAVRAAARPAAMYQPGT